MTKKVKNGLNKVVKVMVFSDFFLNAGWGLISPILAIFIIQSINGGNAMVAGIAVGIYWIAKSILQIPIANYLDKHSGEKDDYLALIIGTVISALSPIIFIFASEPWHMYVGQLVHAVGMAMAIPSWSGIFTRHIVKHREALSWSLDSSSIGIGAGLAGIAGGILVNYVGFTPLFIVLIIFNLIAAFLLLLMMKDILPRMTDDRIFPFPKS